ncbi:alpha/beta hydrolase family protein [Hymenobacter metallilatus]|nr:acetylxylan esterase [Hymenobacter metallilatus]
MKCGGFLALLLVLSWSAAAQKQYNVLDWKAPATLSTYLFQQMHGQYQARQAAWQQAIQSREALQTYQDSVRQRFRRALGPLPARTPLRARITGQLRSPGFGIERLVYESTPNHHVTASLYLPDGKGKRPAVLLFCGHESESKATESYQKTAALFARNGFVVLVIDPVSQGERMQLTDAAGKPLTRGGTTEHTLLNAAATVLGRTAPAAELWDNVRGLDYLLTRKEVDAARVGCLGNSGGATQTAYFLAHDERVKVAALCSYVAAGERNLELTGPADGCVMLPGAGTACLDLADYPLPFAPRPLLLLAGRYDFVDYPSMEATCAELRQAYARLGQAENIRLFTYDDGHGISRPKREAAVRWFCQHLLPTATPVPEDNLPVWPETALRVTPTGQVNTTYAAEQTLAAEYLAAGRHLVKNRPVRTLEQLRPLVARQLALPVPAGPVAVEQKDSVLQAGGLWLHPLILRQAGEPPLPALLWRPRGPVREVVLVLPAEGKASLADSTALFRQQPPGTAVLMADLRGLGETADPSQFNDPKYYNQEYRPALLSLHLGRPLLSQRVSDVNTLLRFISTDAHLQMVAVQVLATGSAGPVALHAAVLAPVIRKVVLRSSPVSWLSVLENPTQKDAYSWLLPGVLLHYDLPELRQLVPAR